MCTVCTWTAHPCTCLYFYFFNNGKSIGIIDQHETSLSCRSITPLFLSFRHYSATFCFYHQSWKMRHHILPKHQYLLIRLYIASQCLTFQTWRWTHHISLKLRFPPIWVHSDANCHHTTISNYEKGGIMFLESVSICLQDSIAPHAVPNFKPEDGGNVFLRNTDVRL